MIKSNQLAVLRSFNVFWNRLKNQNKKMSTTSSSSQERPDPEVSNDPKFKLTFNNETIHSLPLDPVKENYVRSVSGACFSSVNPTPVKDPKVIVVSRLVLKKFSCLRNFRVFGNFVIHEFCSVDFMS